MNDRSSLSRRFRAFVACTVFVSFGVALVAEPVAFTAGDLLGYWPLDGDFKDATGRHDGELVSVDGAPPKFVGGASGRALDLREIESHVELNMAVGAGPKSISLFALTPSFEPELVWVGNRAPGRKGDFDHRFYLGTFTNRVFWGAGRDHRRGKSWPEMAPDRFHHYALVERADGAGGGTLEIYQNGKLIETTPYKGTTASDPARLMRIGRGGGQLTHPALSVVDDVAIFDRAISAAEVAAIAHAGGVGALLKEHVSSGAVSARPRLLITTDGEVDDMNSLIRLLHYANEFELEGLVLSSSCWHYAGDGRGTRFVSKLPDMAARYGERTDLRWTGETWIGEIIDLYAEVYPNLSRHAPGFPEPALLRGLVKVGNIAFEGDMAQETEGSSWIEGLLLDDTPGPLHIQAWGGANTIARALKSIEEKHRATPDWEAIRRKVESKAIIHLVAKQDATHENYIAPHWPGIPVLLNANQFEAIGYGWMRVNPEENQRVLRGSWHGPNLKLGHGALADRYYLWGDGQHTEGDPLQRNGSMDVTREAGREQYDFISEGDSVAIFHLLPLGLRSAEDPTYGGWGGRFRRVDGSATLWIADKQESDCASDADDGEVVHPMGRWIPAIQNDFAARADWAVKSFEEANHPPVVSVAGSLDLSARPGDAIDLAGSATDPDGDEVHLRWWVYREAGTSTHAAELSEFGDGRIRVRVPESTIAGETLHFILEGTDDGSPSLSRYQRVIVTVE